jgi:hypothetical protein
MALNTRSRKRASSGGKKAPWVNRARREQIADALIMTDRALSFSARWGVPGALGFLILSGPILPLIGGGLTPYAGLRSLHVLAGLGLLVAVVYRVLRSGLTSAQFLFTWARTGRRPTILWPDPAQAALVALHGLLLAMMLWTGIERYIGQRWGEVMLPWMSATAWGLAHHLLTPYYVAALLLLWFVKSRIAWRALLDQLRRP